MAGPDTWLGTSRELWKDIVEGNRFPRWFRVLLALLLIGGILWSGFLFRRMVITAHARDLPPPPAGGAAVEKEIASLQETAAGFRNAVLARSGSTQLTIMAATLARRPFSPSEPDMAEGDEVASASAPARRKCGCLTRPSPGQRRTHTAAAASLRRWLPPAARWSS